MGGHGHGGIHLDPPYSPIFIFVSPPPLRRRSTSLDFGQDGHADHLLKGQLPPIHAGVEYRLFSATVTNIKLYLNLNLDLDEARKLLKSLRKHTLFRSLQAVCYSDVLHPLATERLSALIVLNDYMGEKGELVAHLHLCWPRTSRTPFVPSLEAVRYLSSHVTAFRTLIMTSIVHIDSDARHIRSRLLDLNMVNVQTEKNGGIIWSPEARLFKPQPLPHPQTHNHTHPYIFMRIIFRVKLWGQMRLGVEMTR
ncbi:hypothetical protein BU17DRAFT_61207 [Hysterangium stoloniferum]|nr:hypothetical protein BU17DRAFT_61207 [Hysterangium stoloniferum]